ncbi:MAG: carbohydrate kinase family protein [archaeon]
MRICYVGGNVVDWTAKLDKSELARMADLSDENKKKGVFVPKEDIILKLVGGTVMYLTLKAGRENRFEKNITDDSIWTLSDKIEGVTETKSLNCIPRPGGGPTNNYYAAATLEQSFGSVISLELLVSELNRFVRDTLDGELDRSNRSYNWIRKTDGDAINISLRSNGDRVAYTSREKPFEESEIGDLRLKLDRFLRFERNDLLVVNSVKDKSYLEGILDRYDESAKSGNQPHLVAAVTNSMLAERKNGLDVCRLVNSAEIYVSNQEEFFEFTKSEMFTNRGSASQLTSRDFYRGMLKILEGSEGGSSKRRVYVTRGKEGVYMLDSDGILYWQKVSSFSSSKPEGEEMVDQNGAGDTFTGVMTLLEARGGYNSLEILDYAHAAAQLCIRREGANEAGLITRESIRAFREDHEESIRKYDLSKDKFESLLTIKCNL